VGESSVLASKERLPQFNQSQLAHDESRMISEEHHSFMHQNSIIDLANSHAFGPGNMLEKSFNEADEGYSAKSSQSNLTSHRKEDVFNKVRKLN
jgi:hypothetical protein